MSILFLINNYMISITYKYEIVIERKGRKYLNHTIEGRRKQTTLFGNATLLFAGSA